MTSKKEARLKRSLDKRANQTTKSARLSERVIIQDKFIRPDFKPEITKEPRSLPYTSYKDCYFAWCISAADNQGEWSWREPRGWTEKEYSETIEPHLGSYQNNPWKDVENRTYSGKKKIRSLRNKYQPLTSVCSEAQQRWYEQDLLWQFEELFRLRLGSDKRIWGLRISHHFYCIWYERHHKICPIDD